MKTTHHVDNSFTSLIEGNESTTFKKRVFKASLLLSAVAMLGLACVPSRSYPTQADESYASRRQMPQESVALSAEEPQAVADKSPADDFAPNREGYNEVVDNPFHLVADAPISTFSVDVDTASYANIRRMLRQGQWPAQSAIRVEEFINYFTYAYDNPKSEHPIAVHTEVANAPWAPKHRLVKVGIKARSLDVKQRPASNLVFLIDSSGSMSSQNKLPLLKQGLRKMLQGLDERDHVSIVAYAGAAGLVLEPTPPVTTGKS